MPRSEVAYGEGLVLPSYRGVGTLRLVAPKTLHSSANRCLLCGGVPEILLPKHLAWGHCPSGVKFHQLVGLGGQCPIHSPIQFRRAAATEKFDRQFSNVRFLIKSN